MADLLSADAKRLSQDDVARMDKILSKIGERDRYFISATMHMLDEQLRLSSIKLTAAEHRASVAVGALRPFAEEAERWSTDDDASITHPGGPLKVRHVRAAKETLATLTKESQP